MSITDAVGHEVAAALLATLLVGGLRNERRRGSGLYDRTANANDAVEAHAAAGRFVTGQVLRVERGTDYRLQAFELPGDRVVFVTDGMQERNAAELDVAAALAANAELHPREVVHSPGQAVMQATGGTLRDDATVVCLDWYGGPMRYRRSSGGASSAHASS